MKTLRVDVQIQRLSFVYYLLYYYIMLMAPEKLAKKQKLIITSKYRLQTVISYDTYILTYI